MPLTALTELETVEVSLVPKGANLKKRFPIMKRDEENSMSDILHAVIDAQTSEDSHFENVIKSAQLSEEAGEAIKGAMKILSAYADQVPTEQALDVVSSGLGISKSDVAKEDKDEEDEAKKAEHDKDEEKEVKELAVMIAEAEEDEKEKGMHDDEEEKKKGMHEDDEKESASKEDEEDDAKKMMEYKEKEDEDEEAKKSSLQKSMRDLDPAVRDQVQALWKSQKEAVEKAQRLEKSLAAERDERLRKEFVAKAHKEYKFVPGKSPDEIGLMLKSLHAIDSQIAKDIEGIFKSVSAMIEKGSLLDEIGSTMTGAGDSSSAYGKLDSIAKSRVSKSGESYAKAFEFAMKNNPELYTAYLNEQAKG